MLNKRIRIFLVMLAIPLVICLAGGGLIALKGFSDTYSVADVAVVLGNHVYANGTPSPRLASRLDKAAYLYKKGFVPLIIVSGGRGMNKREEAPAMKQYLVDQGIPAGDIVEDPNGVDTRQTAVFTAAFLKKNGLKSAIAVSQYFHLPRCELAFEMEGVPEVGTAHADYREWREIYSLLREIPGYLAYRFRLK